MEKNQKSRRKNSSILVRAPRPAVFVTRSGPETERLGTRIAKILEPGGFSCVVFKGEFGAGKTTMIRGIVRHLTGKDQVFSPSFIFLNEYEGTVPIFHFDFYRMKNPGELETIGFREYAGKGLLLIEWPENAIAQLPPRSIEVTLEYVSLTKRRITLDFHLQ